MKEVLFAALIFGQPIIMGYIAAKKLNQASAGFFWGLVAFILTGSIAFLIVEPALHGPLLFLADGVYSTDRAPEFARILIEVGLSSIIVLAILPVLPKRQVS